MGEKGNPGW